MRIRLLKDVLENGQVKSTVQRSKKTITGWFEGAEFEVSDATGAKLVERGDAVNLDEVPS